MRKIINITGLDCAHCASEFEKIVKESKGITEANFNFMLEKMIVVYDDEKSLKDALKKALKAFPDAEI